MSYSYTDIRGGKGNPSIVKLTRILRILVDKGIIDFGHLCPRLQGYYLIYNK